MSFDVFFKVYFCILNLIKTDKDSDYDLFVPIIDGEIIPDDPETLAISRRKMPIMLGTTRDESALHLCMFLRLKWSF